MVGNTMTEKRFAKVYPNGEPILKSRIQDESWYPNYQALLEMAMHTYGSPDGLANFFLDDYFEVFGKEFANPEQALRWSVLHCDRMKTFVRECGTPDNNIFDEDKKNG